ncbi:MAG TPA: hypothetical protein VFA99_05935 [Acidobacteriaceae bacterium]|nr:hypothetical protein [Acidobacteriaceae bacterium]
MRKLVGAALLIGCGLGSGKQARACSCIGPAPVCSAFWSTPVIFHGRVIERTLIPNIIERKLPDGSTQTLYGNGVYVVRFAVEELFRGDPTAREITVKTNQQSSACGFPFKDDGDYVVFTYKDQKTSELWTTHCSRTHEVTDAAEDADLVWMRGLGTASPTVRLFGSVYLPKGWTGGSPSIQISGPANRTVLPDSMGQFSVDELPAGSYTVTTTAPNGLQSRMKQATVLEVPPKGCANITASFEYDSHVRGHVRDAAGTAIPHLAIKLIRRGPIEPGDYGHFAISDENGAFDFVGEPAGDYVVLANYDGPSPRNPYPPQYYGGGDWDPNTAGVVHLGSSASVDNVDIVMPVAWKSMSIPVRVVMPDGSPVVGAGLWAWAYDESFQASVEPFHAELRNGVGNVSVYAGRRYWLVATLNGPDGHQRCGGPVKFTASGEVKEQVVVIEHDWGNCLRQSSKR